ncbi:MAG TPA: hypothetical protein VK550_29785 [Polyangiaceae bacterium]|nr:hypothetical protein [Polyangiaceae bacterium]
MTAENGILRDRGDVPATLMSDFRRTLPLPPPGRSVGDALDGKGRKIAGASADRQKNLGTPRVPQFAASPGRDLRKSKPGNRKTPHLGRLETSEPATADVGPLERGAPAWMAKARALSAALEEAQRSGAASPKLQACIERAHAAWNLDGAHARHIARVAHLAQRAHEAIRSTSRSALEAAYADCARVVHLGLPSAIKRRVQLDVVIELVRSMRREADSWVAVVEATTVLLGWSDANRARVADAIRQALEEFPPEGAADE